MKRSRHPVPTAAGAPVGTRLHGALRNALDSGRNFKPLPTDRKLRPGVSGLPPFRTRRTIPASASPTAILARTAARGAREPVQAQKAVFQCPVRFWGHLTVCVPEHARLDRP